MNWELLDSNTVGRVRDRIAGLSADSERLFGSLDALGMMRHMRNVLETALEEVSYEDVSKPVVRRIMFLLSCYAMTRWPKGRIKAPAFWTPPPEHDFEKEQGLLLEALGRFVEAHENAPAKVVTNPFFGPLSLRQWSRLTILHFDHHLRQFGA